ncbi:ERMES complex subunit [Rhizoclosmatium hyalinum]|nr:ERMES complex subunit [Rhizoclosmatium hyalinum]
MFKVNWPRFSDDFIAQASQQLTIALNKGQKPNNIVGDIDVADLNMGTKPPDLEILEIGELGEDRFKGIFKMTYAGDAHVILNTRVQQPQITRHYCPVDVNSTFDGVASVRRFLQSQIEGQLRQMFKEDLPMLIHKLSLVLIQQQEEAAAAASSTSSSIQSASGSTDNLKGMGDESDDSLTSSNHKHHHYHPTHLTDETVHRFVNRPHHQKWSGNEPVTVLDSESDAGELESQAIGAYVLHKSLMPDNNLLGLEVVSESILSSSPSSASPTPIPSSIQSDSKSSIKPKSASSRHPYSSNSNHNVSSGAQTSPSPTTSSIANGSQSPIIFKQSLEPASQLAPLSIVPPSSPAAPSAVMSPHSLSNGIRKPVPMNHPISHFMSTSNYQDSVTSNASKSKTSHRFSAPPLGQTHKHPVYSESGRYSPSSPSSPRSGSIIHRSSVSLYNESITMSKNMSSQSFSSNPDGRSSVSSNVASTSRQRYAPAPYSFNSSQHSLYSSAGALGSGKIGGSGLKSGPSSDGGGGNGSISNFSGNGNSDGVHSHKNSESNEPQLILKDKVTLQPSDNQVTAHLASLMLANHTISPVMHRLEHATFRTGGGVSGTSSSSLAAALAAGAMAATQSPPTHSTAVFSSSSLSSHNVTASPTSSAPIKDPSSPSNGSTEKLSSAPTTPFGAGTRKRGGTRNVHKMTLPSNLTAGMPKSSSSGGIFGLDSSTTGARTASSSGRSLGTSSSIASSTRTSRAPSLNEPAAPTLTTRRSNNLKTSTTFNSSRIEESNESGDELAGLLADRLEIHKNRRVSGQSTSSSTAAAATAASISQQHIGIIKRPSLNRYSTSTVSSGESDAFSDDEPLTIQAKSPPTGAGFISRTSMGVFGHSGVLGINNGGLNENGSPTQMTPPPRSTSSMSTRSAGGSVATITTKKVVRVKSNASSMTITAGSLDKFTKEEEEG